MPSPVSEAYSLASGAGFVSARMPMTAKQTSADTKTEAAPPKGFVFYTVKQGDSLFDIAKSYKTTIDSIVKWNGLSGTKIKAGDRLKIKKP